MKLVTTKGKPIDVVAYLTERYDYSVNSATINLTFGIFDPETNEPLHSWDVCDLIQGLYEVELPAHVADWGTGELIGHDVCFCAYKPDIAKLKLGTKVLKWMGSLIGKYADGAGWQSQATAILNGLKVKRVSYRSVDNSRCAVEIPVDNNFREWLDNTIKAFESRYAYRLEKRG